MGSVPNARVTSVPTEGVLTLSNVLCRLYQTGVGNEQNDAVWTVTNRQCADGTQRRCLMDPKEVFRAVSNVGVRTVPIGVRILPTEEWDVYPPRVGSLATVEVATVATVFWGPCPTTWGSSLPSGDYALPAERCGPTRRCLVDINRKGRRPYVPGMFGLLST
jgi:hypothetical protein